MSVQNQPNSNQFQVFDSLLTDKNIKIEKEKQRKGDLYKVNITMGNRVFTQIVHQREIDKTQAMYPKSGDCREKTENIFNDLKNRFSEKSDTIKKADANVKSKINAGYSKGDAPVVLAATDKIMQLTSKEFDKTYEKNAKILVTLGSFDNTVTIEASEVKTNILSKIKNWASNRFGSTVFYTLPNGGPRVSIDLNKLCDALGIKGSKEETISRLKPIFDNLDNPRVRAEDRAYYPTQINKIIKEYQTLGKPVDYSPA